MASDKTRIKVKWFGKEVLAETAKKLDRNAIAVGMMLDGAAVRLLSKGQPAIRYGERLVGLNPSRPGEPPRLLHGNLRNSIYYRTKRERGRVTVYLGANTPYARALELGNPKLTARAHGSARKNVTSLSSAMRTSGAGKARPYLRPTLKANRKKAIERLVRGVFK